MAMTEGNGGPTTADILAQAVALTSSRTPAAMFADRAAIPFWIPEGNDEWSGHVGFGVMEKVLG